MKKRIFAGILAAALSLTLAAAVFAAPSDTNKGVTVADELISNYGTDTIAEEDIPGYAELPVEKQEMLTNKTEFDTETFGLTKPEDYAQFTPVFDLYPMDGSIKDAEGRYLVTLHIAGVAEGAEVVVYHMMTSGEWETVNAVVNAAGNIDLKLNGLSPVVIFVKKADVVPAGAQTSPVTGYADSAWMMWMAGACILAGGASVVMKKAR